MEAVREIRNKAAVTASCTICFSSALFPPQHELMWNKYTEYNLFCRNMNITMKVSPLSNHKSMLKKVKGLAKMATKGECWQEKREGTGLGETLSELGLDRQKTWFATHLIKGMTNEVSHATSCTVNEGSPASLQHTPGYKSPEMIILLKQLGSYVEGSQPARKEKWVSKGKWFGKGAREEDYLRPNLSSIHRRGSSASSSSAGSSRRSSYGAAPRYNNSGSQVDLQRENSDLSNIVSTLKAEKQRDEQERRAIEDKHHLRLDRLYAELEHLGYDRRSLAGKLLKSEQDYIHMKEDRDRIREELHSKNKKQRD